MPRPQQQTLYDPVMERKDTTIREEKQRNTLYQQSIWALQLLAITMQIDIFGTTIEVSAY